MPFTKINFLDTTSSLERFKFAEVNIPDIGTVYNFQKSNQDGTYLTQEWIYIESSTHTESFKIYPFTKQQGKTDLVIADYNIEKFYTKLIEAYLVSYDGSRFLNFSTASTDGITFTYKFKNEIASLAVGHLPSFDYNFDWCDFAFMYRHMVDKEKDFEIGVNVPNSNNEMIYVGKAYFKYLKNEEYKGIFCKCYEISGEAFKNKIGKLYMNSLTGSLVEINMPVRNNRNFNSFLYTYIDKTIMTKEEWNSFIIKKTMESL